MFKGGYKTHPLGLVGIRTVLLVLVFLVFAFVHPFKQRMILSHFIFILFTYNMIILEKNIFKQEAHGPHRSPEQQ